MLKVLNKLRTLELPLRQWMIYQISLLSLGIFIGARFSNFVSKWVILFLIIFLVGGYYIFRLYRNKTDSGYKIHDSRIS